MDIQKTKKGITDNSSCILPLRNDELTLQSDANIDTNDTFNRDSNRQINSNSNFNNNRFKRQTSTSPDENRPRVKRKRNRIPLSCTICRKRKVKCDKSRPHCEQCTKTGVSHLCHYMEQTWAEEAEKELSKEHELQLLKEKVKFLENTIVRLNKQNDVNIPKNETDILDNDTKLGIDNEQLSNMSNDGRASNKNSKNNTLVFKTESTNSETNLFSLASSANSSNCNYANDELDLTRDFDMLHIKSNGTIHLGATHWLAIMKGDPYLKLLWGHIFSMREKLNEWYSQKKNPAGAVDTSNKKSKNLQDSNIGKCPVMHSSTTIRQTNEFTNQPEIKKSKTSSSESCPAMHRSATIGTTSDFKMEDLNSNEFSNNNSIEINESLYPDIDSNSNKCPVDHNAMKKFQDNNTSKCPVDHTALKNFHGSDTSKIQPSIPETFNKVDAKKISTNKNLRGNTLVDSESKTSLPSFQDITSKCPVMHDAIGKTNSLNDFATLAKRKSNDELGLIDNSFLLLTKHQALKKICELLPPVSVIKIYLDHFFNHIYPYIPILDETSFRNHITSIFEVQANSSDPLNSANKSFKISNLKITKQADYCVIGILLIILRITWLSLPSKACKIDLGKEYHSLNVPKTNTASNNQAKDEQVLLQYEIGQEAIELIGKRLIKFDELSSISNNNVSLITIQFAIFLRLYLMCCPEEGNELSLSPAANIGNGQDSESHQVLLSSIIQMSLSCGLHRDPDNFPQLNSVSSMDSTISNATPDSKTGQQLSTERFKHTWRKTWYYVVSLDVDQSLSLGTPRLLRNLRDFSDTKLPSSSKIDYVNDIKELVIVKNATLFFQIDLVIISVLNHILNISISKRVKKHQLDDLIKSLKDLTNGFKSISEVLSQLQNNDLLSESEGWVDHKNNGKNYGLPTMDELLYQFNSKNSPTDSDKNLDLGHRIATKALFFSKHMLIRMLLYILNYILFTHYEPMGNTDPGTTAIAKEYAQETLNYAMDGYRNCLSFFTTVGSSYNSNSIFNYMGVVLAPRCLDIGNRAIQFLICLILRSKCGPLSGMGESVVNTNSGISSNEDDYEKKSCPFTKNPSTMNALSQDKNLKIEEDLADILTARMITFHKLSVQLSPRYQFAKRNVKSTGFFISLLAPSSFRTESNSNTKGISKISGFFKNVPSLLLSGDKESLQRCPVYQDALGFVGTKPGDVSSLLNPAQNIQKSYSASKYELPSLKSYKPVTYSNEGTPQPILDLPEFKKIKRDSSTNNVSLDSMLANNSYSNLVPVPSFEKISANMQSFTKNNGQSGTPLLIEGSNNGIMSNLNTLDGLPPPTNSNNITNNQVNNMNTDTVNNPNVFNLDSQLISDFEDFLVKNSNFNGMVLNTNSLAEMFGMNLEDSDMPLNMDTTDFLPIDNIVLEGMTDFENTELWATTVNNNNNNASFL